MVSKITSKGQLTIPKEIREHLGLKSGDKIQFIVNDQGNVEISPFRISLKALTGILPKPQRTLSVEEMEDIIHSEITKK